MARSPDSFDIVKGLAELGLSDYEISARTGVPRSTVLRWRHRRLPPCHVDPAKIGDWRPRDARAYCYLLGCYLGDGNILHKRPNGWTVRIAYDRIYGGIIDEIRHAMESTFPARLSRQRHSSTAASEVVSISHPAVGRAFPQHGAGAKHLRAITLAQWQRDLTHAHPDALVRGLIDSDGCRVVNRFKTKLPSGRVAEYAYPRYFFSNLSADIRGLFAEHCELLGVRVSQSNHRNLTTSHRIGVAVMDAIVGPKRRARLLPRQRRPH